jgi:hypothetical protein
LFKELGKIMRLKIILFLSLSALSFRDSFGMAGALGTAAELRRAADAITPGAENISEALEGAVHKAGAATEDIVQELSEQVKYTARELPKVAILGVVDGMRAAMGASGQATLPESIIQGTNKLLGTNGADLSDVLQEAINKPIDSAVANVIEHLGGAEGTNLVDALDDAIENATNQCADILVGRLGAQPGTTLPDALNDFQDQAIALTKAKLSNLKNQSINYTKNAYYSFRKKVLIAGAVVGTAALTYYLFKKLTHPGSLNRDSLNKSNLLVESSGFTNGVMSRVASLFRSNKPLKKLILAPNGARQAKEALKNFVTVIKNLRSSSCCLNFKSLLLNGPKGTGKTLFVDHLIKISNLDYVKINSSTFMNFEDGAESKAIASLFGLLKRPKKEIIVVVEGADILLNRPAYKSKLMDLLRWLKSNNGKFMLVVCAENKKHLDNELLALIDNNIEFALPAEQERKKFLAHHSAILVKEHEKTALAEIISSIFNSAKIDEMARQTDGFSYAKLELLMDQIKTDLLRNNDAFTKEHVNAAVHDSLVVKAALLNA